MTNELKPCPFCGGEAFLYDRLHPYVECSDCVAATAFHETIGQAIESWNTRAERTCHVKPLPLSGLTEFECSKCQGAIRQFSNYCPHCGAKVVSENARR